MITFDCRNFVFFLFRENNNGNWNARIKNDQDRAIGCRGINGKVINRNGTKMIDFCISNYLRIGDTFYYEEIEDILIYL